MRKKWLPMLLAACVLLAACGHIDSVKTAIGLTEIAKTYESMPYETFKQQTGKEAELYHADRFIGQIPNSALDVIYLGKLDNDIAAAVLADDDMPIRLQGPLSALVDGVEAEMPLTEFAEALSAKGAAEAVFERLEGGGTAYYVGNEYVQIQFDSDKDGALDRLLLISLDESEGEIVGPESMAWLELL